MNAIKTHTHIEKWKERETVSLYTLSHFKTILVLFTMIVVFDDEVDVDEYFFLLLHNNCKTKMKQEEVEDKEE